MPDSSGVKVIAADVSDPQGGKGVADRMSWSATCKNHIWFYINEENDVTTADQMKAALLSHRGVNGVRVAVVEGQTETHGQEFWTRVRNRCRDLEF